MLVRPLIDAEVDALAQVWYDGWHEAHAHLLPAEVARHRTLDSFRERLHAALPAVRVVGDAGDPLGFHLVKRDELNQLFVAARARGLGAAAALVADAEERIRENGAELAWLACAIGNERAARFYEKCGWRRVGTVISQLTIPGGEIPCEVWRYEKDLRRIEMPADRAPRAGRA
ncbi:MAG TPA: GNAT family N-acetyltransferase [Gemmatimonadaceae bacterium]|jgi:GNAT superfamily N-acetyltransferase|nr:GNAT family N-acetyltransferase [Gemmatimonadaceae bacterium]